MILGQPFISGMVPALYRAMFELKTVKKGQIGQLPLGA
jgi:hypothetical protein